MDRTRPTFAFNTLWIVLCAIFLWSAAGHATEPRANELKILSPANYLSPVLLHKIEKDLGVLIHPTYYYSVNMREHSLREGTHYDVVIVAAESARDYIAEQRAHKLPATLQKRNKLAYPSLDESYGLFLSYTTIGLAYHADRATPPASWADFFQLPQSSYGRVIVPAGHQDIMDAAVLAIGADTRTFSDPQITEAGRLVFRAFQRLGFKQATADTHPLLSGEADYQVLTATEAALLNAQDPKIQFTFPGNQTRLRIQYALLPASSKNTATATKFLEAISADDNAIIQAEYHHFAVSNASVRKTMVARNVQKPRGVNIYPKEDVKLSSSKHADPRMEMRKAYLFERIRNATVY
jgi:spermidine/putrescine-binding protein